MKTSQIWFIAIGLVVVGLGLFAYKVYFLGFPVRPNTSVQVWNIEARVTFDARNEPVKVSLLVPTGSSRFAITGESFISTGYGLLVSTEERNRRATWSIRKASGKQNLYYQATVRAVRTVVSPPDDEPPGVVDPGFRGPALEAAKALLSEVKARSADAVTMVSALLRKLNEQPPSPHVKVLIGEQAKAEKKMEIAVRVLALDGIVARSVHGIKLQEERFEFSKNIPLLHWIEIYQKKKWIAFNPVSGRPSVPSDWLGWWRGKQNPVEVEGGDRVRVRVAVSPRLEEALLAAMGTNSLTKPLIMRFSLFSLPVSTQNVYRVLLMIPVGAFLLALARNVIGINTFGTFMPVLIGLSFRDTGLGTGIILFTIVVALGLTVRFWLERLKLLLVPRLTAILTVVVLLMGVLSVITNDLGLHRGLSVALFPMVILTMTIERMSIVWEERGPREALSAGLGSLVTAVGAYIVMNIKLLDHLVFVFPELLLVVLGLTMLLGRYSGYRLMDLIRFRNLAQG